MIESTLNGLCAAACCLFGTGENGRTSGARRAYQRTRQREATYHLRMLNSQVLANNGAHGMRDEVRFLDAEVLTNLDYRADHIPGA